MGNGGAITSGQEVVLVTGGNGFLGQHIVREIQERDDEVAEIRILDLNQYENKLGHKETKKVVAFVGDLTDLTGETVKKAFSGVDCVIHVAGLVSYRYPVDVQALYDHNIVATRNVVSLCIEEGIGRLVFCSTAEVTMSPYCGSNLSIIVYQTETKALPPNLSGDPLSSSPSCISKDKGLIMSGYAYSKLRAEKIVLEANDSPFKNGTGSLKTVALRPTLLYGEGDQHFVTMACKFGNLLDGKLIQVAGGGGKQQTTYAGNAAWAHICAKNMLKKNPEAVGGLPVFITDETHIDGTLRFIERVTGGRGPNPKIPNNHPAANAYQKGQRSPYHVVAWSIPMIISYLFAFLLEMIVAWVLHPLFGLILPVSPRVAISYMGSVLLFSRLRASIAMDYDPVYTMSESITKSLDYYTRQRLIDLGKLGKSTSGDILKRK